MANPVEIIVDILLFLVRTTWNTISFLGGKIVELFLSLLEISSQNFLSLVVAALFGGVVIYLVLKYLFKTTKLFILILLAYIIAVIILLSLTG